LGAELGVDFAGATWWGDPAHNRDSTIPAASCGFDKRETARTGKKVAKTAFSVALPPSQARSAQPLEVLIERRKHCQAQKRRSQLQQ
jgi:hypothetical protein